jgi:hypothetical protein
VINLSSPAAQQALAHVAAQTSLSTADLAAWATVASEDDARAILGAYELANARPLDVSTFDRLMAALGLVSRLAGLALPILGMVPAIRTIFAP